MLIICTIYTQADFRECGTLVPEASWFACVPVWAHRSRAAIGCCDHGFRGSFVDSLIRLEFVDVDGPRLSVRAATHLVGYRAQLANYVEWPEVW